MWDSPDEDSVRPATLILASLSIALLVSACASSAWTSYTAASTRNYRDLPSNLIHDLTVDGEGRLWAATWDGVAVLDGDEWRSYDTRNSGLSEDAVLSVAQDAQGTL